jgi:hypothetical protein
MRPLYEIAKDISNDWRNVNYAAKPYLAAMRDLNHISDRYLYDSAESVVLRFLSNAASWRGEKARAIKAELKSMVQS